MLRSRMPGRGIARTSPIPTAAAETIQRSRSRWIATRPHLGHFGASGLDRTHQLAVTPTVELPGGPRLSMIALLASPLPLSGFVPQQNGGGVAGEIFRSDVSGDGTVGDLLSSGTYIGTLGRYSPTQLDKSIKFYNDNVAGHFTPAARPCECRTLQRQPVGGAWSLCSAHILVQPTDSSCGLPGRPATATNWLKTVDFRLHGHFAGGRALPDSSRTSPSSMPSTLPISGVPTSQLSGILNGAPGTSLNNSTSPGVCGASTSFCTSRLDRILPGSGAYSTGAPRQMQFGVRVIF